MQRYVASELTHFVGRGKPAEEQYSVLLKILRTGWLTHPPHNPLQTGNLSVNLDAKFSTNEMFNPEIVCFCDIPVDDLAIHISKYSPFGLALPKNLIVHTAGSPVRYLPLAGGSAAFDALAPALSATLIELLISAEPEERQDVHELTRLVNFQLLSFIKFYDHTLPDDHPDNYYMEREWRVVGNVQFKLEDVTRVIIPKAFASRFRKDLPTFMGQISFAEA